MSKNLVAWVIPILIRGHNKKNANSNKSNKYLVLRQRTKDLGFFKTKTKTKDLRFFSFQLTLNSVDKSYTNPFIA